MAHRERFMDEVRPGVWVVQCRICPKRAMPRLGYPGGKATFETAKECHRWWESHSASKEHLREASPEGRSGREHDRSVRRLDMDGWIKHTVACDRCRAVAQVDSLR